MLLACGGLSGAQPQQQASLPTELPCWTSALPSNRYSFPVFPGVLVMRALLYCTFVPVPGYIT